MNEVVQLLQHLVAQLLLAHAGGNRGVGLEMLLLSLLQLTSSALTPREVLLRLLGLSLLLLRLLLVLLLRKLSFISCGPCDFVAAAALLCNRINCCISQALNWHCTIRQHDKWREQIDHR